VPRALVKLFPTCCVGLDFGTRPRGAFEARRVRGRAALLACLEKRPEDRPASAHVLGERLRACAARGSWTNARAADWWARHRHELRSGGAQKHGVREVREVSDTRAAQPLTITRVA